MFNSTTPDSNQLPGEFAQDVDYIVGPIRLAVSDVVFMTPEDDRRQQAARQRPETLEHSSRTNRLTVPPTLIIESVNLGHGDRDRKIKNRWYAEAGMPNYWIFDAHKKRLDAHQLRDGSYQIDRTVRNSETFEPSLFPGFKISMQSIWFELEPADQQFPLKDHLLR